MTAIKDLMTLEHFSAHGLRLRQVQIDVARDVEKTLLHKPVADKTVTVKDEDGQEKDLLVHRSVVGLIEAGTGTGKTLAYLMPLLRHQMQTRQQVAISTFTRALQRQIFSGDGHGAGDLALAMALTGSQATMAMRMGRANFICRKRVRDLQARMTEGDRQQEDWRAFFGWVQAWDENTDPMETTFMAWRDRQPDLPFVGGQELIEDAVSLDEGDEEEDSFWYDRHAEQARAADVVITNHATLLLNAVVDGAILGSISAVVIDEADRLRSAAQSLLQRRIRWDLLYSRAKRREPEKLTAAAKQHIDEIQRILTDMGLENSYDEMSIGTMARRLPALSAELLEHMREVQLPLSKRDAAPVKAIVDAIDAALQHRLPTQQDQANQSLTLTFSPVRFYPSFAIDPVDVRGLLSRLFRAWEDREPIGHVVLTSATLSDPMRNSLNHVEIDYGIDTDAVVVRESYEPSRYGAMRFVLPDPRVDEPMKFYTDENTMRFQPGWLAYLNAALDTAPERKKLMLTGSFMEVENLIALRAGHDLGEAQRKTQVIDGVLYHQPDKPGHKLLSQLRDPDIRAIVTPSFWEGANLVVDKTLWMQDLMIARMPIPPFSSLLQERMIHRMMETGRAGSRGEAMQRLFMESCAAALRKLRQGIGRGIRGENDRVQVWFLDPRMALPADWRSLFRDADHDDVENILNAAKTMRDRAQHPALESWTRSVPTRFQGAVSQARMFSQDGEFIDLSMEVA